MEKFISVFDMFKIGVGPSSSHTLGPWKAALHCMQQFQLKNEIAQITYIQILLYGSLAKTGKGHGSDMAVLMGLLGENPISTDIHLISTKIEEIKKTKSIVLNGLHAVNFNIETDLMFLRDQSLAHHPNALQFLVTVGSDTFTYTYYSIGGGFIEFSDALDASMNIITVDTNIKSSIEIPFDFYTTEELLHWCMKTGMSISEVVKENEKTILSENTVNENLDHIWQTMFNCIYKGCKTDGVLPGGLQVRRRAFDLNKQLLNQNEYI